MGAPGERCEQRSTRVMTVMVVRPADGLGVRKGKGSQETPGVWLEHLKGQSFHQVSWRRLGKSQSRGSSGTGHIEFEMQTRASKWRFVRARCLPLERARWSCAFPGWVPRTEQRALLFEPLVYQPLTAPALLISPISEAHCPSPSVTWRRSPCP